MSTTNTRFPTIGQIVLGLLAVVGISLIAYRFVYGIGAVANLSDGYPWGVWIALDVLTGIALASGGFVMAGTIHLFGGRKFHALARPAILTAFLGYLLFIIGLLVDIGRPWNIWKAMYSWHHESPMFEVAWCVMLYTTVLFLEFLPAVFEKFSLTRIHAYWHSLVPWLIMFMLGFFTLAMTYSWLWAGIIICILLLWELAMRTKLMPRDKQMPIILIMAGVIFSCMHQSSLGTLFLIVPHKLHILWYTPILPALFLLSAIMVAPAMVIVEAILTEKSVGHKAHTHLLSRLGQVIPYLLSLYLLLKVADVVGRGAVPYVFMLNAQAISWWAEITIGCIVPIILFLDPAICNSHKGLLWSSVPVIVGILWNRMNVAVVGIKVEDWEIYYPKWSELFITMGIISIGLLVFQILAKNLPIYESEAPSGAHN
jgi:formate dehydrogenase iron-sulfur subunit